jgi:hypothetical protein
VQLFDSVNIYPPWFWFLEHFLESKKLWFGILGKKKIGIEQTLIVVFEKIK